MTKAKYWVVNFTLISHFIIVRLLEEGGELEAPNFSTSLQFARRIITND